MAGMFDMASVFGFVFSDGGMQREPKILVAFRNLSSHETEVTMEEGKGWLPARFTLRPSDTKIVGTTLPVETVNSTFTNAIRIKYTWNASTNTYTFIDQ